MDAFEEEKLNTEAISLLLRLDARIGFGFTVWTAGIAFDRLESI